MATGLFRNDDERASVRRARWTIALLVAFVLLAGLLRVGFNYEAAAGDGYRYAGNDDYYHLRVVQHVQTEGNHLVDDPLLNYPLPAKNPRPPVYDWSVAILGQILAAITPMEDEEAGMYALEWGSAIWGTLIAIPVFLAGRALYSNGTGLWAAFLIAASPSNIQRSGFGLGDHDAFILFFLVLGAYFLIRALQRTRDAKFVSSWTDFGAVARGFSKYASKHPTALAYSFLAGVSWGTIALMWEGFPYALAIFAIYYFIQVLTNQVRQRDATGDVLNMIVLMGTIVAFALPFYWRHGNIQSTMTSANYILLGLVVLTFALVVTRDLPWIVVLPSLAGVGAVALAIVTLALPDIGRQLFTANGYFVQNRLYSTIAEAQRTDLGVFVFSVGFMTFFLGLVGFGFGVARVLRGWPRDQVFILGWATVGIFMSFAASRFVYNATPVFALLAGWTLARMVQWMDFRRAQRNFTSMKADGVIRATRAGMTGKVVVGTLFIVITLIVPNLWFSVDAGVPGDFRAQARENHPGQRDLIQNRTGAFGQGFLARTWLDVYGWLDEQDQELAPEQRCAHMAWWDYGFWEVALAHHPTVADNFQNGFQLSGRFLAAQDEQEAVEWMTIRILEGERRNQGGEFRADVSQRLDEVRAGLAAQLRPLVNVRGYDDAQALLRTAVPERVAAVNLYEDLKASTGYCIGYFLVDDRMLPFDDPRTPNIDSGSILYAPLFLANKNPDEFVQTTYNAQGNQYFVNGYQVDDQGEVRQMSPPTITDQTGREYFVSGGLLFRATPDGQRIDYAFNQGQGLPLESTSLTYRDTFYQTMFYRAFVGGGKPDFGSFPSEFQPGADLAHFRLVKQAGREPFGVKLLEYFPGAVVSGTVLDSRGEPMAGLLVAAVDDMGITHDVVTTDDLGRYSVIGPFGTADDAGALQATSFEVRQGATVITSSGLFITRDQALRRDAYEFTLDFDVDGATVEGLVYTDRDHDGEYNASIDGPAANATVSAGPGFVTTADADGRFVLTQLRPGSTRIEATNVTAYEDASRSLTLASGESRTVNISMPVIRATVVGSIFEAGNETAAYQVNFTATQPEVDYGRGETARAGANGNFTQRMFPGMYVGTVEHEGSMYTVEFELLVGQAEFRLPASAWTRSTS